MSEETKDIHLVADVSAQRVARVYAEALLNAADKESQADAVFEELESLVHDVFAAQPQFETLLSSAAAGRKARADILQSVFAGRASKLFYNFLLVLNDQDRLDLLRAILAAYRELNDERHARIRVQVESAVPLPEDQKAHLQEQIREAFHLEPMVEAKVNASLLGGLRVRVGDWLYDASVRTRLDKIRNQLIAGSSHEIQSQRDRFCLAEGN
jgi:F-type H+-transporting ATPase subunit delta